MYVCMYLCMYMCKCTYAIFYKFIYCLYIHVMVCYWYINCLKA